ncbi:MAG TPA: hypothetical protein PLB01_04780 [Thermoanaerobaculia bacterium]|nr:hypothetical protein [Thermoanaerobaculia bacterium]
MSERNAVAAPLRLGLAAGVVFAPLAAVLALGAGAASLWLDEITYARLQSDFALRAAEIGRSGSAVAPYFSNFFYCDVQKVFQSLLAATGLVRFESSPEWLVRSLSVAAYAATVVLVGVRARRRELPGSGTLGAFLFAAAPVFLYYAFEARVYALVSFLAVLLLERIEKTAARVTVPAILAVAFLGVVVARLHLWTLCLFAALFARAAVEVVRRRRATPLARVLLAASVPALATIFLEYGFMKATQPPEPLFALFARQPLGGTLLQTGLSIFEGPLQVQSAFQEPLTRAFVAGCLVLLGVLVIGALREPEAEGAFGARSAAAVALFALAISVALAVGFGYFVHGRYQVPLFAVLFWAVARSLTNRRRLLLALLFAAAEAVLLPSTAAAIRAKSNDAEIAGVIAKGGDRSTTAVVVQHGVISGYPAPHHTIGLDFYLNDVHPGGARIPLFELPDLRAVQGDHGTYRYFNGGAPLLSRILEIRPEVFRTWADREAPADVWVVQPLWDVARSREQIAAFLEVLVGERRYAVAGAFVADGYPRARVIHLRRGPQAPGAADSGPGHAANAMVGEQTRQ